jgi:hypothetical protein
MLLSDLSGALRKRNQWICRISVICLALAAQASVAEAGLVDISFDPLQQHPAGQTGSVPVGETPANSLSYWGVTFTSKEPSNVDVCASGASNLAALCFGDDINTASLGLTYLSGDVLSGSLSNPDPVTGVSSGSLTLNFLAPTTMLDFGAVVGTGDSELLSVALSGPQYTGAPAETMTLQTLSGVLSEGEFLYSGAAVTQAVLTFTSDSVPIFAIDNLTFTSPQVPEPNSLKLFAIAVLFILTQVGSRRAAEVAAAKV